LATDTIAFRGTHIAYYWLTPPTRLTFIISLVLAILALLVHYAHVAVPVVSAHVFETLLIAYVVLLAGNLFRGI
jgi:small-conductance mechanosensitive channel